jgi:5-hydroxyisourate hydrolase
MSGISTHVLDLALGKPAFNLPVRLERFEFGNWVAIASRDTNADGRCDEIIPPNDVSPGHYRLIFATDKYHHAALYPEVVITFLVGPGTANYHMPLLLSPNGYTTYRGS